MDGTLASRTPDPNPSPACRSGPRWYLFCGQAPAVFEQLAIVPVRGQDHSSGGSAHLDCDCTPARVCPGAGHQQPPPTRREPRHRRRQPHRGRPHSTNRPVVSNWGTRIGCPGALAAGSFSPPTTPAGLPDQLPAFHSLPATSATGIWLPPHYCPVSPFRRARWTRRNVMTVARTNNGSKMKTNNEFESTTTTSSSV